MCEQQCRSMTEESHLKDSNLLLLDEILIPFEETEVDPFSKEYPIYHTQYKRQVGLARQERDHALTLARHYRGEKRVVQQKLEKQVELTHDF